MIRMASSAHPVTPIPIPAFAAVEREDPPTSLFEEAGAVRWLVKFI
jgi:hypothetical protein